MGGSGKRKEKGRKVEKRNERKGISIFLYIFLSNY